MWLPAPESPFVNLLLLSAPNASSVSEQPHPLHIVLKAGDYGFIGVKLKELIFPAGGEEVERAGAYGISGVYRRLSARRASATDFSMRAGSSRTPPTLMRTKVFPFRT